MITAHELRKIADTSIESYKDMMKEYVKQNLPEALEIVEDNAIRFAKFGYVCAKFNCLPSQKSLKVYASEVKAPDQIVGNFIEDIKRYFIRQFEIELAKDGFQIMDIIEDAESKDSYAIISWKEQ